MGTTNWRDLDVLSFVDYINPSKYNLENLLDNAERALERRNHTIEWDTPYSNKQLKHWFKLMYSAENTCIAIEDMINNYSMVKPYLLN